NLLGFVDDRLYIKNSESEKVEMLGNLHELNNILNSHVVDEVMISLPIKSYYNEIEAIIKQCEKQGVVVRLLTDIFTVSLAKSQLSYVDEVPVLTLYSAPYEDSRMIVKRDLDIVLSFGLIILLLPVLLVVAAAIKLTSPGPALFIQKRVGYNKRIFSMLKFRTMIAGAEELLPSLEEINESGGATFKLKNDPRVTKLGRFLRRSSLDEMPQLLNVLKGDMSLVGPRPLPVRDYKGFDSDWQKRRFSMKPGLTCFWQIGGRSNVSFSRWMQMDMEYIDKWSLWLDLKILWKTIPVVFSGRGAV
ncbi:sugar transferase, partial [bacterium]|nr:sugar transferase [bacterium]